MTRALFLLATAACWAGPASGQCLSSVPACAQTCLASAASSSTSCGTTDYGCQCADETWKAIWQGSENCLVASCGQTVTYDTVQAAAEAFCYAVNAGQACSSASSSSSSPTTGGGTSTTYTSTTTTLTGSASAPATSGASASSGTTGSASSAAGTATAATSSSTAGAAVRGPIGSLGMMVLGALALV